MPATGSANATATAATRSGFTGLARLGYLAKGLVYVIIGLLAALAASGLGGGTTDRQGAIETIHQEPFGQILLGLVALGLVGYALWSFIRAAFDPEGEGTGPQGLLTRIGYGGAGISHAALAFAALQLLIGSGNAGKSSDASAQDWTARLLQQPYGPILVVIVGLVVLGVALAQFYQAYTAKFQKYLRLGQLSAEGTHWIVRLGRLGLAARGVVFGIIGLFLIVAAWRHNPGEARGLGGALQELARQPFGNVLLGVVALGLLAYGIYTVAQARYRQVSPP